MRSKQGFAIVVLIVTCLFGDQARAAPESITAAVKAVDAAHSQITLAPDGTPITADASAVKDGLSLLKAGDQVQATIDPGPPAKVSHLELKAVPVPWEVRAGVLLACFLGLVGVGALVTGGRPREFLLGADRRYSNSKVQITLWFSMLMTAYFATLILRVWAGGGLTYLGGVGIPENLLIMSGFSALTYGGAKAITTQKIDTITSTGAPSPKIAAATPNLTTDLFQNDLGEADIGDFQMILITLTAVVIFALSVMHFLGTIPLTAETILPDMDTTLLSTFGLGQGAYLIKKMASDPGQG